MELLQLDTPPLGQVVRRILPEAEGEKYYFSLPRQLNPHTRLLVCVHGISRRARKQARFFAALAEQYNVAILAPCFSLHRFPDYQRLGRRGRGARADHHLERVLAAFCAETGVAGDRFYLFGYSGGAQFAHRYAMAYPHRVAALALGAAGWYTLPDERQPFPYGIAAGQEPGGVTFAAERFLTIPTCVLVGELDDHSDAALRQSKRINRQQGETRVERGGNWLHRMRTAARQYGYDTHFEMKILPRSDHSFSRCVRCGGMDRHVFEFLFGALMAWQ